LFVLQDIVFTGSWITCPIAPTPFERFVSGRWKPSTITSNAHSAPQLKQSVIDKLLEEYPWLKASDFATAVDAAYRKSTGGDGGGHGSGAGKSLLELEDISEKVLLEALDELDAKREEFEDDTEEQLHFYVRVLGSRWTKAFKGVSADCVCASARAHCRFWCDLYGMQQSESYAFSEYGEHDSMMLANERLRIRLYGTDWLFHVGRHGCVAQWYDSRSACERSRAQFPEQPTLWLS
jgi:hypothetical protein